MVKQLNEVYARGLLRAEGHKVGNRVDEWEEISRDDENTGDGRREFGESCDSGLCKGKQAASANLLICDKRGKGDREWILGVGRESSSCD